VRGSAPALRPPEKAPAAVVELDGARVLYGGRPVVDIGHLAVRPGELLVVIGPNGSGKSTLLRVLGLLEVPAAGSVRFRGQRVASGERLHARRQMASVFQDPLLADTTVFDNVAMGLRFRGLSREALTPRVQHWMERLGIGPLADRRARTLSGGEAQRTALARALVLQPALLLLDEPFSALDQPTRETLIAELGRILRHDRITTVLVTHDRGEAMALGDRVAAMIDGRILQLDLASRLFRAPVSEAVARFVGVETIADARVVSAAGGVLALDVGGQKVEVAQGQGQAGDPVRLCVRPEDVTLSAPGEVLMSGRCNQLTGIIAGLSPAGTQVRAQVDCGFPLVALVPRRAVEDMALVEGMRVVARFEASAAHVIAGRE
jgi:tungstate transport system ATP-binding protein